jgi:hypothetical protein
MAEASAALAGEFSAARDATAQEDAARTVFGQLGNTSLMLGRFDLRNPDGRFVPLSQWKELRRAWAAAMEKELAAAQTRRVERIQRASRVALPLADGKGGGGEASSSARTALRWSLKVDRLASVAAFEDDDWKDLDEAVVEISRDPLPELAAGLAELGERIGRERLRLALPIITRAWEEDDLRQKIAALFAAGWRAWEGANLSAWEYLTLNTKTQRHEDTKGTARAEDGLDVSTDWSVYVTNLAAARAVLERGAARVTLSPEDGLANYGALLSALGPRATVIVYQDTPLFISETCVYANMRGGCAGPARCPRPNLPLVSGFGDRLLAVSERCRTIVVNQKPFCLAGRWKELLAAGAVRVRADFMYRPYAAAEVRSTWRLLRAGKAPAESHVGNFDRGLL